MLKDNNNPSQKPATTKPDNSADIMVWVVLIIGVVTAIALHI